MSTAVAPGVGQITSMNIQDMDLETAMMSVQAGRAQNLEKQMINQIETVKTQNEKMANLNELMVSLNSALSKFEPKATPDARLGNVKGWSDGNFSISETINQAATKAGYSLDLHSGTIKKSELEIAVQDIKSKIDAASNNQQMDILRLQSLSNKRNEAFDTMTNFIKKMQDSRSSIVGNMR